jgi:tetratricopeptide (TPR) repeat protein
LNSSFDEPALRAALAHLDRAITRDSSCAAAFAAKSEAWMLLVDGFVSPREGYGQARAAASRALALDSSQALAYAMLGGAVLALDMNAHEAERLDRRAVALNPHGDHAHMTLSQALMAAGRLDEAVEEARRASEADSLVSANGMLYIDALILSHRLDSAAALLPRLQAVLPPADVDAEEGRLLAARGDLRGALQFVGWRYFGGWVAGTYVRALLAHGDTAAARATVDSMLAARRPGYYNPVALAKAYVALGDMDKGIEWLRRAIDERSLWLIDLRLEDELAPLRADPRYAALDRQLRY